MRVKMSIELKNIDKSKNRVWYNYYVTTAIRKYFDFKSVFLLNMILIFLQFQIPY